VAIEIVHVPDLGGAESVEVIELSVNPGDTVEPEQSLMVLESDKATMDIPCPMAGVVKSFLVDVGAKVSEGSAIVELETDASQEADEPATEPVNPEAESDSSPEAEETQAELQPAEPSAPAPTSTPVSSTTVAEQTVQVPDIGSSEAVEIIDVMVAAGDVIAEGDSLLVLETDKATVEVPSPLAGEVVSLLVKTGDKVSQGDDIAVVKTVAPADGSQACTAQQSTTKSANEPQSNSTPPVVSNVAKEPENAGSPKTEASNDGDAANSSAMLPGADVYAGPAARQLARELQLDLRKVKGTGPRGRILKEDLNAYLKNAVAKAESGGAATGSGIPAVPDIDFSQFGDTEIIPLTKIQKVTAANMQRSWLNVPHVTQFDDADITELEAFRKSLKTEAEKRDTRVSPLPFLIKACAYALAEFPEFNRSLSGDGESFVQKQYINIGMAVDTPRGLVVPVIRNVPGKGIWQLASEVNELAAKARDGKLTAADMQGGCFTISSLGAIGGQGFTPIVNAPEVAILGVSKSQIKPVWDGEQFAPRLMLPLSLSYDHRVINGADCGRFFTFLIETLADIRRLAL
jgi:pyruvate dehydrogenase E2 component (dihydrolipoamide acetyltransferase)